MSAIVDYRTFGRITSLGYRRCDMTRSIHVYDPRRFRVLLFLVLVLTFGVWAQAFASVLLYSVFVSSSQQASDLFWVFFSIILVLDLARLGIAYWFYKTFLARTD